MANIRVDLPYMRQAIANLRLNAEGHRAIADTALQITRGAPSYDGELGPRVEADGLEIHSRYVQRHREISEQADHVERIVDAFEEADLAYRDRFEQLLVASPASDPRPNGDRPWWAPLIIGMADGWDWYDQNVNPVVYSAMGAIADSLKSIGDPNRNPRMAAFHRMLWDGLESWEDIARMYALTVGYTAQAGLEGRWDDAGRGFQGVVQEELELAKAGVQGIGLLIWGIVTTPFRLPQDIGEFASAIDERGQGLDRGWDVIFTGTMLAGDVSGTYALARPLGLVNRVNRLVPQKVPTSLEPGVQILEQTGASFRGQNVGRLLRSGEVPVETVEGIGVAGGVRRGSGILVTADAKYPGSTGAALFEEVAHTLQRGSLGLGAEVEAKAAVAQWVLNNKVEVNPSWYLSRDIFAFQNGFAQGGTEGGLAAIRQLLISENYPNIYNVMRPGFLYIRDFLTDSWIIASGIPHDGLQDSAPQPTTP